MRARAVVFIHLSYLFAGGGADVSLENPESFLKVDESTVREELVVRMMLINAVSMPNDVSGATHWAQVPNQQTYFKLICWISRFVRKIDGMKILWASFLSVGTQCLHSIHSKTPPMPSSCLSLCLFFLIFGAFCPRKKIEKQDVHSLVSVMGHCHGRRKQMTSRREGGALLR